MTETASTTSASSLDAAIATIEQALHPGSPGAATPTAAQALDVWFDTYVRDSAISRDTSAYNAVFGHTQQIKAAIAAVKES